MKTSKVRKILDKRGLSLTTGAKLIGKSRRTMSYYVSGEQQISEGDLYALEHKPKEKEKRTNQTLEYYYSHYLKRYIVRSETVTLSGKGVRLEHRRGCGKKYNIYFLTSSAFEALKSEYLLVNMIR